jgi:tetratricopeptide (TPR) repeat protein
MVESTMQEYDIQQLKDLREQLIQSLLGGHKTLLEAVGLGQDDILGLALYARQLAQEGRLDVARELLTSLATLDAENGYVQICLGCVEMQLGETETAIATFERALELEPDSIAAHTHLGELLLETADLERAAIHIHRAVELDPKGADPFAARARTLAATVVAFAKEVERRGPEFLEQAHERIEKAKALALQPAES